MKPTRITLICAMSVCLFILTFACPLLTAGAPPIFQGQTRVGFTVGDQWEPAIAVDRYGHVYILIPQYSNPTQTTIPTCPACPSPTVFLIVSNDNGSTWSAPRIIAPPGSGQIDVQIKVDPVDGTMDQYGNASALAKRKANRPIVQRLLQRPANQEVSIQ